MLIPDSADAQTVSTGDDLPQVRVTAPKRQAAKRQARRASRVGPPQLRPIQAMRQSIPSSAMERASQATVHRLKRAYRGIQRRS